MKANAEPKFVSVLVLGDDGIVRKELRECSAEEMRQTQKRIDERWAEVKKMPYRPMSIEEFETDMAALWERVKKRKNRKEAAPERMAAAVHA